ncbi:MAG TPA: hypothetical protein V6D07_00205 [Trichocoleus sp.]
MLTAIISLRWGMTLSWQERFRAIFTGLVVADLRSDVGAMEAPREDALDLSCTPALESTRAQTLTWRQVLIQLAQVYGQERLPSLGHCSEQIRMLEADNPLGVCFAALPLMLLNLDGPGSGAIALVRWAEQQGLRVETQNLLEAVFHLLRRGVESVQPLSASMPPPKTLDWLTSASLSDPLLTLATEITVQARGQYALALRLADLAPAKPRELPLLVGVLSTLQEGLSGIPLSWRLQYLNSAANQSARIYNWAIANEAALWQLADGLFYRWAGVSSSIKPDQLGLTYPVAQLGANLHWASGRSGL